MNSIHKLFCGGPFAFNSRSEDFLEQAENDYRAMLLGGAIQLFRPTCDEEERIFPNVDYIGPFFFQADKLGGDGIIQIELKMIERCTEAIFLLDHATCPGSVAELMYASQLNKNVHLFFVTLDKDREIESWLHTPCWYPILLSQMLNPNTHLHPSASVEEAKNEILRFVRGLPLEAISQDDSNHIVFTPSPIDTSETMLPEGLSILKEAIAKNVHDTWAQSRINEGWTYGPLRNDNLKQHPCLIPYEELPEIEKEYDRTTAMETLKLITKFGWIISKQTT